jgi:hypothetical protein
VPVQMRVRGLMRCRRDRCKAICVWCVLNTVGFPVEHMVWDRAPLFRLIPPLLGIH